MLNDYIAGMHIAELAEKYGIGCTKALRKAAGIKVKDVADTLGVSTQAVAKWQAGTALPTIDNLVILAAMLDTKIDDILVIA
jgi:transcriptional regulator with XRE-family HTH domain